MTPTLVTETSVSSEILESTPTAQEQNAPLSVPDLIFHNGVLLTMESTQPQAQAIAILGTKILAVGNNEEILDMAGPDTQVIDLAGQTMLPGLADGHSHIFWVPPDMALDEVQNLVLSYGFTSVTEMTSKDGHLERLLQAESEGTLRVRVNVFPNYNDSVLDDNGDMLPVKYWYPEHEPILDSDRLVRVPGIKIFVDGADMPRRGCLAMREPYDEALQVQDWFIQACGSEYGDLYWPQQDELNRVVADAQAAGFRVALHAMGDKAIAVALDAIEFALNGQSNTAVRHQIQHNSFLAPDLLERYIQLDILSSVRGHFNTCDQEWYREYYHNENASNRYALPGLGLHAFLETDARWSEDPTDVSLSRTLNPMVQLWALVTHKQLRSDGTTCEPDPWIAKHVITVDQALRMMTYEPVYAVSQEQVLGSLSPGKYADLVILSANPREVEPDKLKDLKVWMTMVGGRVEYCAVGHDMVCPSEQTSSTQKPDEGVQESPGETVIINVLASGEKQVPAGAIIQMTVGWVTNTEEQANDFLAAVSMKGSLDGAPLPDLNRYWSAVEPYESSHGELKGYLARWLYPLGVLSPGGHEIVIWGTLDHPVTDGYDTNNDGQPDEYSGEIWHITMQITVDE